MYIFTYVVLDPDSSNKKLAGWSPLKTSLNRGEIGTRFITIYIILNYN